MHLVNPRLRLSVLLVLIAVTLGSALSAAAADLDLIANSAAACGPPPINPSPTDEREHIFLTQTLAVNLGVDLAAVQLSGPSPQVRVVVDSPLMGNGLTSTAAYTVARICTGSTAEKAWVWNIDRLFLDPPVTLSNVGISLQPMAPSRTTEIGGSTTQHFAEPNAGSKYLRENVTIDSDKRVALLVPHGGGIELNTSRQIDAFVDELDDATPIGVNVWEVVGQWGSGQTFDRWHVTSNDIHPDGYPGLDQLLSEPMWDAATGMHFRYSVALHGFGDNSDFGIILGGLAERNLRCHVAATIRSVAGARGQEIGFHIAEAAADGGDLLVANSRGYVPAPSNVQDLEGTSTDNIVNWTSEAVTPMGIAYGGIQLEQSKCLRKESGCTYGIAGCTSDEAVCMHNVVAQGVARALEEVLDGTTNPAGACCSHFGACYTFSTSQP